MKPDRANTFEFFGGKIVDVVCKSIEYLCFY